MGTVAPRKCTPLVDLVVEVAVVETSVVLEGVPTLASLKSKRGGDEVAELLNGIVDVVEKLHSLFCRRRRLVERGDEFGNGVPLRP